ncbi:hypothetical protein K1T71_013099 [Dendrolimus kikuchii]|uniref:Uncharacterized protein n=1 Tax=Dendrolimus kikuchii TaxID=765133 RepID=A0ACC1CJC4_9NEOP|nr:hypothetical protein K1T71_013099 [Dendrolimus kikuchii]
MFSTEFLAATLTATTFPHSALCACALSTSKKDFE